MDLIVSVGPKEENGPVLPWLPHVLSVRLLWLCLHFTNLPLSLSTHWELSASSYDEGGVVNLGVCTCSG